MQNAPAMLGQKMMNRQAPYGPIGMVAQNMSGNKKRAAAGGGTSGPVIGLVFDTTSASPGVTFSNGNITANNPSGPQTYASAKASSGSRTGANTSFYFEFIVGNTSDQQFGFARSDFASNHADSINNIVGGLSAVPSFSYRPSTGSVSYGGTGAFGTIDAATTGDVIGITVTLTNISCTINVFKNNVNLSTFNASGDLPGGFTNSYVPAWSSRAVGAFSTLYNSIFVQSGFTPLGSSPDTLAASASVPAVADGAYDVYTFNASGTFTVASTGAVRALVIAGGGGTNTVGGAGAGGYQEKGIVVTPQTYTITVGAGGSTGVGANSSVAAVVVSTGGGVGAPFGTKNGGSGGGAYRDAANNIAAGTGIAGQGFNGGSVTFSGGATEWAEGGGGGAGGLGGNGSTTVGGNGGAGLTSSITGTAVARGGGGGAYSFDGVTNYYGTATAGGGSQSGGVNGTANTGGGAGPSGAGGSGVVIIRVRARA